LMPFGFGREWEFVSTGVWEVNPYGAAGLVGARIGQTDESLSGIEIHDSACGLDVRGFA